MGKVTVVGGKVGMAFNGRLSISPTTLSLTNDKPTGTITVTRVGDGAISAVSSNTSVATVSVSGNVVTVTGVGSGNANITISVAATETHKAPDDVVCTVTCSMSIALSEIAEGSIVYISESGTSTPFYVAKHNYESGLNGNGKTLLVRQKCHSGNRMWGYYGAWGEAINESTSVPYWLNNTYKNTLPSAVQSLLGTSFRAPSSVNVVRTYTAKVFTPSLVEYGMSGGGTGDALQMNDSPLPIASTLKIAYYGSTKVDYWTRTTNVNVGDEGEEEVFLMLITGSCSKCPSTERSYVRPCFTLPATAKFNPDTLAFEGV